MTPQAEDDAPPLHSGPDPHDWPKEEHRLWSAILDIEALGRAIEALEGPVFPADTQVHEEARMFLGNARKNQRALLAELVLSAYQVPAPEEPADLATEAVGGIRGDSDRPGDRDHLRGV